MRLRTALPLFFLILLAGASREETPNVPMIAVMALSGVGVDSASAQVATDALSDELLRSGGVRVMERSQMEAVLKEQGFQQSGACDGSECAVRVGKLLSVGKMVVGSLGRIGSTYTLSVRAVDVETGEVVGSVRRLWRGEIDQAVTDEIPDAARELAGGISGRPLQASQERRRLPETPAQTETPANVPVGSAPIPGKGDTLWPLKDAVVDPEDWNLGLNSDVRLMYSEGVVLIDFGDVPRRLAQYRRRGVRRAVLELSTWAVQMERSSDTLRSLGLELGTISSDWTEGTGNWFWNRGGWQNNGRAAYVWYPNYKAPAASEDPAVASGIRWSNSSDVRRSFQGFSKVQVPIAYVTPNRYPRLSETTRWQLDVTREIQEMLTGDVAHSLAIRLDTRVRGRQAQAVGIYAKDHEAPKLSGPLLVIR